jgi:hypothetical protein
MMGDMMGEMMGDCKRKREYLYRTLKLEVISSLILSQRLAEKTVEL